jgi:hypothetical protein
MTMTTKSGGRTFVIGQAEVRHENHRIARAVKAILFAALAVAGATSATA